VKPLVLLLGASLLANAAWIAVTVTRPDRAEAPAPAATPHVSSAPSSDTLRAALASGDAAALEAAGLPRELARELALGRTVARFADQARAAQAQPAGDGRWWRTRHSAAARDAQLAARRQLAAALGLDLGAAGDSAQFAFLPDAKRDQLRRIIDDYDEMMAKFSAAGLQLPSDREKLRLLRAERERDIAALLSPEERLAYDLRTSPSAATVRARYGEAIESEAELQKIYALQKAFDDKFPREALTGRIAPETLAARAAAERQLDADLRAAVGDDRYAALRRAADSDVRLLDGLAARLSLPATTTDTVLALRDSLAAASQRINGDPSLPLPERRTQLQALATQAKSDLARTLGAEAAGAYAQASPWVNHLSNGLAYSTQPPANALGALSLGGPPSVYPVMPAGASVGTAQRQVVVNNAAVFESALPVERPAGGGALQVMTFSTAETTTPAPAASAGAAGKAPPAAPKP
jgi:hypothetical protein